MFPGKRWIAGFSRNAASSAAGSVFAIRPGSSVPIRCFSFSGPGERGRHGHLLVERKADQQRHRLLREERVGLVVAGEVQAVGHAPILDTLARSGTTKGGFVKVRIALVALVAAAALAGVALAKGPSGSSTGTGTVFFPNPVAQLQDESLTDQKDADYAALQPAYKNVTLTNLDGSGTLTGDWAQVVSETGDPARSATNTFTYHRNDDRFEQVMAYYWITEAQKYIQSLGFGTGTYPAVNMQSQRRADQPARGRTTRSRPTTRRTSSASARAASTTPRTPR